MIWFHNITEICSILRTIWRITQVGAKVNLPSRTSYWTHCIQKTNVFGFSWRVLCCWIECPNLKMLLSGKYSVVSSYSWINTQFVPFKYCSISSRWNFSHHKYPTQQYSEWALDKDCKLGSRIVFCKPSWSWKNFLLKQHFKKMMPELLQSHHSVCGFYTVYAACHLFKLPQEDFTGVHNGKVFSFSPKYVYFFLLFNLKVQVTQCFCYFFYSIWLFETIIQSLYIAFGWNSILSPDK